MLFYIRDKGQALEAVVSQAPIPPRNGVAAGMKKRKAFDLDDEGSQDDIGVKTERPFIGPQLPPPSPSSSANPSNPNTTDPQAEIVKKKIAAASKAQAAQVLRNLSLYADDEESSKEGSLPIEQDHTILSTTPSSTPPSPSASSPLSPSSIPTDNFYNASSKKVDKKTKRKSPDEDEDEDVDGSNQSQGDWVRIPLPNSPTFSSPHFKHRKKSTFSTLGGGNPFNRVRGANNLHQKDSTKYRSPITYKKKRTFAI
jgi:ubiquitin carboxyl-terminal hydrolase 36/42